MYVVQNTCGETSLGTKAQNFWKVVGFASCLLEVWLLHIYTFKEQLLTHIQLVDDTRMDAFKAYAITLSNQERESTHVGFVSLSRGFNGASFV